MSNGERKHIHFDDDDDMVDLTENLIKGSKDKETATPKLGSTLKDKTPQKQDGNVGFSFFNDIKRDESNLRQEGLDKTIDLANKLKLPIPKQNFFREDEMAPLLDYDFNNNNVAIVKACSMRTIRLYFEMLHKYLDTFCFTQGSFIIQDNNNKLYNLLKTCSHSINFNTTHRSFFKKGESEFMELSFTDDNITINCNDRRQPNCRIPGVKKLVKWYKFTENGNTFIFAKLEREAESLSVAHASNKLSKMFFGAHDNCLQSRREDCSKYKNCKYNPENPPLIGTLDFYKKTVIEYKDKRGNQTFENNDTYSRVGDEMFIIQPVSEFIIETIDNNKDFNAVQFSQGNELFDFETIKISQVDKPKGGKTRKINKAKKTRKQIKPRKQIKHIKPKKRKTNKRKTRK